MWRVHNDDDLFWASVNIVPGEAVNQDCLEIQSEYAHDGDVRRAAADVWPLAAEVTQSWTARLPRCDTDS